MKILEITSDNIKYNEFKKIDSAPQLENNDITQTDKLRGFIGKAYVYDEEIFINTFTGEGYDLVINKMRNYIDWYSGHIRLSGFDREDIKQLICLILLDGIRRFDPRPGNMQNDIKLSTFLYIHIKNRIISRIKEETKQSLDATYNESLCKFVCPCGASFISTRNMATKLICDSCKNIVTHVWKTRSEHHEPLSLDAIVTFDDIGNDHNDKISRIQYNGRKNNVINFFGHVDELEDMNRNIDFVKILSEEDEITRKIAELIYHKDYSITDAAKEVGLTCWAASLRLKKLKNKKYIKEFFINI